MKVLVVGGGGREHAIAWSISKSPRVSEVFCAPGNAGIASIATCVDIGASDIDRLVSFAKEMSIDLTVVGPEDALCRGIVDRFNAEGLRIFGPTAQAAEIEGSKIYCKKILTKYLIPTASSRTVEDMEQGQRFLETSDYPVVIKADGLAAGKGVFIAKNEDEAIAALEAIFVERRFGDAGQRVLLEQHLQGEEASVFAFTDGNTIAVLPTARDYKRISDDDMGPNTGGMGAFSPSTRMTPALMDQIVGQILVPMVHAMNREGRTYKGVLYAGLMLTKSGPKVIEFNARLGDPETQAVLLRMRSDIVDVFDAVIDERLDSVELDFDERPACCVVMASEGYPGAATLGKVIGGLNDAGGMDDVVVFHAGTRQRFEDVVTSGGRVLGVTALGDDLADARKRAYAAVDAISFVGSQVRSDIAK